MKHNLEACSNHLQPIIGAWYPQEGKLVEFTWFTSLLSSPSCIWCVGSNPVAETLRFFGSKRVWYGLQPIIFCIDALRVGEPNMFGDMPAIAWCEPTRHPLSLSLVSFYICYHTAFTAKSNSFILWMCTYQWRYSHYNHYQSYPVILRSFLLKAICQNIIYIYI